MIKGEKVFIMFAPLNSDYVIRGSMRRMVVHPKARIEGMRWKILICAVISMLVIPMFAVVASGSAPGQGQTSASETDYRGGNSFADDLFGDRRRSFGFSLGAYQMYDSNLFFRRSGREDGFVTTIFPRVFFNAGRHRTRFHADYGTGYWLYNGRGGLNAAGHFGNFQFTRQLSRRISFHIADQLSSSPNEYGSFLSPIVSSTPQVTGFSNEVLVDRQRITRNIITGGLDFQVGRKGSLGIFGGYYLHRYRLRELHNADALQVGATYDHRITNWLYLSNSYHAYLNRVDEFFRDARIHRLQVGGLSFRLGKHWRLNASGGVEWANHLEENRLGESITAGIARNSRDNLILVGYQRGFTSAIGLSRVYRSDIVTAGFGQRISRWMGFRASSSYWRGSGQGTGNEIEYFLAQTGLDFLLRSDLVASIGGSYHNQASGAFASEPLNRERYLVVFGLQYLWPAVAR